MKGRKPKPRHLKLLEGNPGRRPLPANEPKPDPSIPKCPSWLNAVAKRLWRDLAPELHKMGVLTLADRNALELLCDAYSEYRAARDYIRRHGATYETVTATGSVSVQRRPEWFIAKDAWTRVQKQLVEFGLTPSSRTRIAAEPVPDEEDEFEKFLRRGKRGRDG